MVFYVIIYGIYFGKNDPRNTSKRISGKQTNNTAELKAVIEVFHILKKDLGLFIVLFLINGGLMSFIIQYLLKILTDFQKIYGKKLTLI